MMPGGLLVRDRRKRGHVGGPNSKRRTMERCSQGAILKEYIRMEAGARCRMLAGKARVKLRYAVVWPLLRPTCSS